METNLIIEELRARAALDWTRKRWPVTNTKRAFTGDCTCTIICARIGRNWRNGYGRGIRTTVYGCKNPARTNPGGVVKIPMWAIR